MDAGQPLIPRREGDEHLESRFVKFMGLCLSILVPPAKIDDVI